LWPSGCMNQDATCYSVGRPRSRPHCVWWGPSFSTPSPKIFGQCLLWLNSRMDQDATWYRGRPRPRQQCYLGTQLPHTERDTEASPDLICGPYLLWRNGWMDQNTIWYGGRPRPRRHCVRGPSSAHGKEAQHPPHFSAQVYCGQTVVHLGNCWALVYLFRHFVPPLGLPHRTVVWIIAACIIQIKIEHNYKLRFNMITNKLRSKQGGPKIWHHYFVRVNFTKY